MIFLGGTSGFHDGQVDLQNHFHNFLIIYQFIVQVLYVHITW